MQVVYLPYRKDHLGRKTPFMTAYADKQEAIDAVKSSIDVNIRSRYRYDLSEDDFKVEHLTTVDSSVLWPELHRWYIYRVSPSGDVAICEIFGIEELQLKEKES